MKTNNFITKLKNEIFDKYSGNISEICIVFPSKRAGAVLNYEIANSKDIHKPLRSPKISGIQNFISDTLTQNTDLFIADDLILIFELYECYKTESEEESFDKFYPWGRMMLSDFDEIDRNLVEADYLFRVLAEHKEVEEKFGFSPSESEEFELFWKSFSNKVLTREQNDFIKTWEIMGKVYRTFRKRLTEKNICYEGMAYRKIYELARTKKLELNFDKVIFAGFNQLNRAEELIIKELVKQEKAELYWDADEYYVNNKTMEAGVFLRQNIAKAGDNKNLWIEQNIKNSAKEIIITGASLAAGQTKALGYLLDKNLSEIQDLDKTAIVLPDESMLMPVLHSIPESINKLNVTMGYPFKNSSLYNLLENLASLHKNKKGNENNPVFYHKDCTAVLAHPYIKGINSEACLNVINEINKRNIIYLSGERLITLSGNLKITEKIFKPVNTPNALIIYLHELINDLTSAENISVFEKEFFFSLYEKINHINSLLNKYAKDSEAGVLWKIITEVMAQVKIPFTGEPLKGLQVMGLLETRSLDFDNVYILSMNEGTVPRGNSKSSYIPYHLRRAFRLPTYEDDDAAFAYYFYRLIQRTGNVHLIYNNKTEGLLSGEKSRFILQAEIELPANNNKIKIKNSAFQAGLDEYKNKQIIINKSQADINKLISRKYSPSALADYISCSLKFYFSRIAGLKKEESVEEAFSGASFGSLLHEIMSQLYAERLDRLINADDIKSVKKRLGDNFDQVWENACDKIDELKEFSKNIYGKNILFKNVILKLAGLILDYDIEQAPFMLKHLEGKITGNINTDDGNIELTGRLDRVELKDGITRIIDYKTGAFSMKAQDNISNEEFFENVYTNPDYKESFQQYFYAMLYQKKYPGTKINIGIYPLRAVSGGISFYENEYIATEKLEVFTGRIKLLFSEILDPLVPFKKTDDIKRCKYCEFTSICYRE